ncbi:hypothetical protein ACJMK2_005835 [Sinanodonta woodiana]|uniref:Uncharacterized protein n=1 Tax=Sinanodonta woodiana TaxID=1069815 RepID=A0ABD3VRC0_SINWO
MARYCNINAFKENRKVEFGWINDGKQLMTATGGGTRKIELPRNSRKEEVLDEAKTLFSQPIMPRLVVLWINI